MMVSGERDESQLAIILHTEDVKDTINTENLNLHCTRVLRNYFDSDRFPCLFSKDEELKKKIGSLGPRYLNIDVADEMDANSIALMRTYNFQPSLGYINHLRIFFNIWMAFLPIDLFPYSVW